MATLTVMSSKLNDVDPRASVSTWSSARYAPSVFTFNANWTPTPLSAPAPLQFFSDSAAASSSRASPSCWNSVESYLRGRRPCRAGPSSAPPETFDDDVERVSHLNFDSDSDGEEGGREERRYGRYDWHKEQLARHEDNYDDEDSSDPTPTQEQVNFKTFASVRRGSSPVTGSNALLRAYLESYGFPDGLGYERPPLGLSYRSSSPSSHYSFRGDANSDDDFDDNKINSKFAYHYPRRSCPNTNSSTYPNLHSELPPLAPSAWPTSLKASNALLASLALDSALLDDPCGAWEALCWDEAAPESDSDSEAGLEFEHDGQAEQDQVSQLRTGLGGAVDGWLRSTGQDDVGGLEYRAHEKAEEETWRESSPSPVFRRRDDITESDVDTEVHHDDDEADIRTVSNVAWNDAGDTSGASTSTSTGTSTITAGDSEEWISLTGARAQAARARILPYRYVQAPFPMYPQTGTDVSMLAASLDVDRTARTPVDPVIARTPPVPPVMGHHETGSADAPAVNAELGEMLANTEGEGVTEGETAPDYGECGRDRLVSLSERDPPPYDLEYESTYASRSASRMQDRPGDAEDIQVGSQPQATPSSASFSQSHLQAQPKIFTRASATRTRSQLTFPTSPTESDTIHGTISPTSTFSSNPTPLFSTSPISPTTTETTALMTPAGAHFSTVFSNVQSFRESSQYSHAAPSSAKMGSGFTQGDSAAESRPNSPPYQFSQGGSIAASQARTTRGPRPLPPRPGGMGARTMAEAWLSASAAGPYATGSSARVVSAFASGPGPTPGAGLVRFASWNGNGYGFTSSLGIGSSPQERGTAGRRSPVHTSDFGTGANGGDDRANGSEESNAGVQSSENTVVPDTANSDRATVRYPFNLTSSVLSTPLGISYSTESLVRLNMIEEKENEREKDSDESLGDVRSSSETTFQIIASKIKIKADGIGMQPAPPLQRGKRNRSGSGNSSAGKSLQRLATRCSTLTRRIGLVAGGKDR
ncbi:hypothetical protein ACEPAF_5499 [Sanghuangporus sanghuang]